MPSKSRRVFIIVKAPNGDVREVPIGATAVVVGRDESADIRVEDKKVSRRHASFKLIDGEPWVEDLGSANGVKLNGKRIDKRARFGVDDKVRVGGYQVTLKDQADDTGSSVVEEDRRAAMAASGVGAPVSQISRDEVTPSRTAGLGATAIKAKKTAALPDDGKSPVLEALDDPVKGQRFVLHPGENIVGRLEECDIPVLDGSVSRQHARVVFARDRLSVTDLGSSNGTFVNDMRVEMAELANGDSLRIGNIRFKLTLPPELAQLQASAPVKTRARAKKEGASTGRPWAVAGMVILLVAIAVLSFTIYWKWRARSVGGDTVLAGIADAGTAPVAMLEVPDLGVAPTIEPIRTIEPLQPADAGAVLEVDPVVETSTAAQTYAFAAVQTATTPYAPKDELGLPSNLPPVDERFEFDAFVAERVAAVQAVEQQGDWAKLEELVKELLERDPINAEAKNVWKRVVLHGTAVDAMTKAERLVDKGELARALKLYASVPEGAPEFEKAHKKVEELRKPAIESELQKAEKALDAKSWLPAHKRFRAVLELDPENAQALEGIRSAERKLRKKNVRFAAYVPPGTGQPAQRETPEEIDQALSKHYAGDDALAAIASLYAKGKIDAAKKKAEAVEKRSDGDRKETAKRIKSALKKIDSLIERIRNEISNDPNVAWDKLRDLERTESEILPSDVRSYVKKELEVTLAEAFAIGGASMFDRGKLDEAFQRWESGYQLDATNPKILAGLKKLEDQAKTLAEEAQISAQRGERKACEKVKSITHITRKDSEVHKRALELARSVCG